MSQQAFWKAICAEPDEDTPRLVFADWLDERGDPASTARAEFIRTQIELTHIEPWSDRAIELRIRERQLLHEHRKAWLYELPVWVPRREAVFARGFVAGITCSTDKYLDIAERLAKKTVVQELCISEVTRQTAAEVAASPHLNRIRAFHLSNETTWPDWAPVLLASKHLTDLRELRIQGSWNRNGDFPLTQLQAMLRTPAMANLERLRLHLRRAYYDVAMPAAVGDVIARTWLPKLQTLVLRIPDLDETQLNRLLAASTTANVVDLGLPRFPHLISAKGLLPEMPKLRVIGLEQVNETDWQSPWLQHVAAVRVWGWRENAAAALKSSPVAGQLRSLALERTPWEFRNQLYTKDLFPLPGLRNLQLTGADGRAMQDFARMEGFDELRHLDLSRTWITPVVLDLLHASPHFPKLQAVTVGHDLGPGNLTNLPSLQAFAAKYADRFAVLVA